MHWGVSEQKSEGQVDSGHATVHANPTPTQQQHHGFFKDPDISKQTNSRAVFGGSELAM